ncbi:MAG: hypothetical protein FJZ01_05255 [Candidatus Sericytochromatia bacterium]|nr:hypothetical protein [Candidatus Tanganyikabacteria bacterium]
MNWGAISHLAKGQVAGARKGFDQASAGFAHKLWGVADVVGKDFDKAISLRNATRSKVRREVYDNAASSLLWLSGWLRSNTLNATTPEGRAAVVKQLKVVMRSRDVVAARALVRHPKSSLRFEAAHKALAHSHVKRESVAKLPAYREVKKAFDRISEALGRPAGKRVKDEGILEIAYQDLDAVRYFIPNNKGARTREGQTAFREGFKALRDNPLLAGLRKFFG